MGTRNLTIVTLAGVNRVAQYGQWDGYPSGQGKTILEFLKNQFNREKFIARLDITYFPTDEQDQDMLVEAGGERGAEWINMAVSDKLNQLYPSTHRNTGGRILELIQEGQFTVTEYKFADGLGVLQQVVRAAGARIPLSDASDYLNDAEWAYQINLDTNKLVVYGWGSSIKDGIRQPLAEYDLASLPAQDVFEVDLVGKSDEDE